MLATMKRVIIAKREEAEKNDKGFTLIELLVVVLIIGILAAIAIPVFLSQQNSAKEAGSRTDAANLKTAVVTYQVANNGTLPTGVSALSEYNESANTSTSSISAGTDGAFCVQTTSTTGTTFAADSKSEVIEGTCVSGAATAAS